MILVRFMAQFADLEGLDQISRTAMIQIAV